MATSRKQAAEHVEEPEAGESSVAVDGVDETGPDEVEVVEPVSEPAEETPAPEEAQPEPAKPFISEGIRQELEMHGKATDPGTGLALELDRETGEITVAPRPAAGQAVSLTT